LGTGPDGDVCVDGRLGCCPRSAARRRRSPTWRAARTSAIEAEGGGEQEIVGRIVVGTVQGDLHDIGKNIFVALARNAGFVVNDLGIDVPPATFVEHVRRDGADILAMSGILTMSVGSMIKTVEALEEAGLRDKVKVIIGGLPVDGRWNESVGSDAYTDNAYEGLKMVQAFMGVA
jgi:dimethylamine corrinoid protein